MLRNRKTTKDFIVCLIDIFYYILLPKLKNPEMQFISIESNRAQKHDSHFTCGFLQHMLELQKEFKSL